MSAIATRDKASVRWDENAASRFTNRRQHAPELLAAPLLLHRSGGRLKRKSLAGLPAGDKGEARSAPGETAGIVPLQERRARPPGFRFGPSACSESASTPARVWRGAGRRVPRVVSPALVWQCILASWRTRKQREPSRWREELATHDDEQGHSQAGYGVAVIDGVHGQGFWAGAGQTCPPAPMRTHTEPRGGFTRMASESAATTV